ncbi:MAG: SRPBCC family protein [Micropruina sp.]
MSEFSIARSVQIAAEPQRVHALINDFRQWVSWSPWEELDPGMTHTYTGAQTGVGARHDWSGNSKAGQGSMTIVASAPELIELDLAFVKPFKATNHVRLDLRPQGDETQVTWTMTGQQGFFGRLFYRLLKMEQALGRDFERGLNKLKAVAEA